ncbi:MAG TPA: hypothetical protein VG733_06915, partial [Chthoniobacteraceae bacterium]|nr:hypothetical protein [Chthoniobacteraceae bacterium]
FEYPAESKSFTWVADQGLGGGGAMRAQFEKGQVAGGGLKVLFGRNPFGSGIRKEETFRDIYWRVYVKHEAGWEGNPAKLVRATCLASRDWTQGFIAHVWGGKDDCLCIDPATGIVNNQKVTTKYNDFAHLKWLGMRNGKTPIFSTAESGRWVCVESHLKLNTPGKSDGVFELWVDGRLEASHDDLDWQGTWGDYAIDAVFLENYWNEGSVKRQARWFDDFAISTERVRPVVAAQPVTINRTRAGESVAWEAQVASDAGGKEIVWNSGPVAAATASVIVDVAHGQFGDKWLGKTALIPGTYWVRVREAGQQEWSPWHAPFRIDSTLGKG